MPLIAEQWTAVKNDGALLAKYSQAAEEDATRYQREVAEFQKKMEDEGKTADEIGELLSIKRKAKADDGGRFDRMFAPIFAEMLDRVLDQMLCAAR